MAASQLDQIVKGAPPPDKPIPTLPTSGVLTTPPPSLTAPATSLSDPLASLPSSPHQIYLNLLILEASLRKQYLEIRARRRRYTFFLLLLGIWNLCFGYAYYFAPREDGSGHGGSIYWAVESFEGSALLTGVIVALLVWATGEWERGIRWPRRWVGVTNRGLREFNCKVVVVKGSFWEEWFSILRFILSKNLFSSDPNSSYRYIDPSMNLASSTNNNNERSHRPLPNLPNLPNIHEDDISHTPTGYEEDLSPGGDHLRIVLLPKPFSATFRENWDTYRRSYWERENERRFRLRQKLREHDKRRARERTGLSLFQRFWRIRGGQSPKDVEKSHHSAHHRQLSSVNAALRGERRMRERGSSIRSSDAQQSHSRTSSRSTTPTPDVVVDEHGSLLTGSGRPRRGSTASNTSSASSSLRKKRPTSSSSAAGAGTGGPVGGGSVIRPRLAPSSSGLSESGNPSLLARQSRNSFSSTDGSRPSTPAETAESLRSLRVGGEAGGRDSPEKK
jgi:hypothetical protein